MSAETYPSDLLYLPEHDWARLAGELATLGVTWFAQEQLGEIVFWDGPELGIEIKHGAAYAELESVKAVSEVIAPLSGEVVEVNAALTDEPALINRSPYGDGWLVRVRLTEPSECAALLDANAYRELL